jgi:ribulose-5-phosphate 4-epimerase/fuculose-1-phosphate aldolase
MEASFHSVIYKHSNNTVIAHTHPVNTLKILCSDRINEFAENRLFPDHVVFNGQQSYVIPYVTPGEKLAESIAQKIIEIGGCPGLFLLQNHGIICCAKSVGHAIVMTEICEKAAEVFLGCPRPKFLTAFEVDDIRRNEDEHYRWSVGYDH